VGGLAGKAAVTSLRARVVAASWMPRRTDDSSAIGATADSGAAGYLRAEYARDRCRLCTPRCRRHSRACGRRRAALAQELFAVAAVLAVRRRADDTGAIGAVRERRRHGALRHPQLQIVVQVRRPLALEDRLQLHAVLPDDRACGGSEQIRVAVLVPARLRLLAEDLPVLTGQIRGVRLPGGDARHREGRLHRSKRVAVATRVVTAERRRG